METGRVYVSGIHCKVIVHHILQDDRLNCAIFKSFIRSLYTMNISSQSQQHHPKPQQHPKPPCHPPPPPS